jgi:hypothetical protein
MMYSDDMESQAATMSSRNDSKLECGLSQAFLATYAQMEKSSGFKSGELGGQKCYG